MEQDAKEAPQDAQPSAEITKPSGEEVEHVFTASETQFLAEAFANQKHSKLDKEISTLRKFVGAGELIKRDLESLKSDYAKLEEQKFGEGGEEVAGLTKKLREEQAKLAEERRALGLDILAHMDEKEKANEVMRQQSATDIANQYQISREAILAMNPQNPEQMEAIAKTIREEADKAKSTATPSLHADSGGTLGGRDWESMPPEEKIRFGVEHSKPRKASR